MDQIDKQTILNNIDKLMEVTEFELLIEKCQNAKLISNIMVRNIHVSHFFFACFQGQKSFKSGILNSISLAE